MSIYLDKINKSFDQNHILKDVELKVKAGELTALLGPSGSGKTTLLRIIAGLEFADKGAVLLDGENANKKHIRDRNVGFVFQHYALFKNMTVFENVAFGLKVRNKKTRPGKAEIEHRVMKLLKLMHLDRYFNRYPSQLSGGQRQRIALARALAVEPKYLLLDEPFGALDAKVRKELRSWLRKLHDTIDVTTIFVTHDQEEAMEVADKIVIMGNGKIEQSGTPSQIYQDPENMFVYDFLGNYNSFKGWQDKKGNVHLADEDVEESFLRHALFNPPEWIKKSLLRKVTLNKVTFGKFGKEPLSEEEIEEQERKKAEAEARKDTRIVNIYARPHEMLVVKHKDTHKYITSKVVHINPSGFAVKVELESKSGRLIQAEISREEMKNLDLKKYDEVFVRPKKVRAFTRSQN